MAAWDADSPRLRLNLARVLAGLQADAARRVMPTAAAAKAWQRDTMAGLSVPDPAGIGRFRGEPGLEDRWVRVGAAMGAAPEDVGDELAAFERRLVRVVTALDERYPSHDDLDGDGISAVLDLAAWVHAQWVRIHPFLNGNGRTARLWANLLLMRYGLPPIVRLRPRPGGGYGAAGARAMAGDWQPTAFVFRVWLREATVASPPAAGARQPKRR